MLKSFPLIASWQSEQRCRHPSADQGLLCLLLSLFFPPPLPHLHALLNVVISPYILIYSIHFYFKDSWFTVLQVCSKVVQLYIHIYINFSDSFTLEVIVRYQE